MKKVVFRVKGISPNTWSLKTRNAFGKKNIGSYLADKEIGYFPGKESPFVEDNKDVKQAAVPIFTFSDESGRTELIVNESNKSLINYLEAHPWFNKRFEKFDSNEEAKRELERYDQTEKALEFLKDKQPHEIIALGLLVLGAHAVNMGELNVQKDLKKIAFSTPQRIIDVTNNIDFNTLLIGAVAFVKGIVTTNDTKTAVVWKDNKGVIVRVATGENPIEKLSQFLVSDTDESRTTLQEMGNRIGANEAASNSEQVDDKDAVIAELKAKLEALQTEPTKTLIEGTEAAEGDEDDIESLREAFKAKFGKDVAPVKKNDADWIKAKLAE